MVATPRETVALTLRTVPGTDVDVRTVRVAALLVPMRFVAVAENVYSRPGCRFVYVRSNAVAEVWASALPPLSWYDVIGAPPSRAGAATRIVTELAVTPADDSTGEAGASSAAIVRVAIEIDNAPSPAEFPPRIWTAYAVSGVSP